MLQGLGLGQRICSSENHTVLRTSCHSCQSQQPTRAEEGSYHSQPRACRGATHVSDTLHCSASCTNRSASQMPSSLTSTLP